MRVFLMQDENGHGLERPVSAEVPNGTWCAKGSIDALVPHDRPNTDKVGGKSATEESFLIKQGSASSVRRRVVSVFHDVTGGGHFLQTEFLWTSPEPFVVLIRSISRVSGEMAKGKIRIYWSRQVHEGQLSQFIPVPKLNKYSSPGKDGGPSLEWVCLYEVMMTLAKAGLEFSVKTVVDLLGLTIFTPKNQPTYAFAEDVDAIKRGEIVAHPLVDAGIVPASQGTSWFMSAPKVDGKDFAKVIVAWQAASDLLRLAQLGVKGGRDLIGGSTII